jgi:hypothetical protein
MVVLFLAYLYAYAFFSFSYDWLTSAIEKVREEIEKDKQEI